MIRLSLSETPADPPTENKGLTTNSQPAMAGPGTDGGAGSAGSNQPGDAQPAGRNAATSCAWENRPPQDDPKLITDFHLVAFRAWLEQVPRNRSGGYGLAAGTVIKHLANLRAILRTLGPRETGNPHGLGLIDAIPAARFPKQPRRPVRVLTDGELDRLYEAAKLQTWPAARARRDQGELAEAAYRTLIVGLTCNGFRTEEAVLLRTDHYRREPASPLPQAPDLSSPYGWIEVDAGKTGKAYWLPLLEVARKHLDRIDLLRHKYPHRFTIAAAIRERSRLDESIQWLLPFGGKYSDSTWGVHWRALRDRAGLPDVTPKHLRKTCSTRWNTLGNQLGAWVTGHAQKGVNETHYQGKDQELIDRGVSFPLPSSFHGWRHWDRQRLLFN